MLKTFGKDQGGGFDTGCQFKTTLARSDLGALARELNYTSLVDAFHGHTHQRLCQLSNLATYKTGLGLEDLGMCERAFSHSNPMAGVTHYMSKFHRMQAIVQHFQNMDDLENYRNMSKSMYKPTSFIYLTSFKRPFCITITSKLYVSWTKHLALLQSQKPTSELPTMASSNNGWLRRKRIWRASRRSLKLKQLKWITTRGS